MKDRNPRAAYAPSLPAMKEQGITLGVARPPKKGGCWALVRLRAGPSWPRYTSCGNPPRNGFLTCVKHQDRKAAARELQAKSSTSTSK